MTQLSLPDDVLFRTVGDEIVILDLQSGTYYGLDPVGTRFWLLLDELHDFDAVVARMEEEFEIDRETLERDLLELVGALREAKLLRVAD